MSAMGRDASTTAKHLYVVFGEHWQTWIQDDSKHVLNLRHGVGEDGSDLADIGLCFALIWGLNNCSVFHKAAANGGP